MHNSAWVKLLRHIPASEQCKLVLVTSSGVEITIQGLLRVDPECLAFRGRLAGSTDAGRVFFVPYANIEYFGFQQALKETEFHELFGNLGPLGAAAALAERDQPEGAPGADAAVSPMPMVNESATLVPPSSPTPAPPRSPSAIKSAVLEKFRSRSLTSPGTQMRPALEE